MVSTNGNALVESRKVKRYTSKHSCWDPCTLGGVSWNTLWKRIRLANFSCMYINLRFVAVMRRKCPLLKCVVALLALFMLLQESAQSKVIIHVPYQVKNVKHTHTIYKIIPHYREDKSEDLEEDDKYETY
ncbi:PREDICTED: uncharacterized protein LOC108546047 [Eufriesea mexicana]|uniref:uncharacterized protein LOC108546047 n=1 Tax=Eufriesea mexicana TaxID=516756 RepID=UPI00083C6544|nr:PREDICTED: uncharacterized protein LOC108546047 [Eufriesea mexicana]